MVKAEDATPRTWAAVPPGIVYVGTWWTGSALLDPTDGLIANVAGWNRVLAPTEIQRLVHTRSVAWAEDIDAGAVQAAQSKVISVRQGRWHGKTPLTVTAGNGSLVTTTESGDEITILAGGTTGNDATFTYSFTDANGNTSQTNKGRLGAYSIPQKCNLWWMQAANGVESCSIRFLNCLCDGFLTVTRPGGKPRFIKFHQCRLRYWGMDGSLATETPSESLEYIRTQMFEFTFAGWKGQAASHTGNQYVGYCLLINFRPSWMRMLGGTARFRKAINLSVEEP